MKVAEASLSGGKVIAGNPARVDKFDNKSRR